MELNSDSSERRRTETGVMQRQRHTRAQTVTAGLISNYQGEVTSSALPAIYHQLFLTLQQTGLTPPAG